MLSRDLYEVIDFFLICEGKTFANLSSPLRQSLKTLGLDKFAQSGFKELHWKRLFLALIISYV